MVPRRGARRRRRRHGLHVGVLLLRVREGRQQRGQRVARALCRPQRARPQRMHLGEPDAAGRGGQAAARGARASPAAGWRSAALAMQILADEQRPATAGTSREPLLACKERGGRRSACAAARATGAPLPQCCAVVDNRRPGSERSSSAFRCPAATCAGVLAAGAMDAPANWRVELARASASIAPGALAARAPAASGGAAAP